MRPGKRPERATPVRKDRLERYRAIPEGNYGAGAVIVWDRGLWVPLEDPDPESIYSGLTLEELESGTERAQEIRTELARLEAPRKKVAAEKVGLMLAEASPSCRRCSAAAEPAKTGDRVHPGGSSRLFTVVADDERWPRS